MPPSHRPRGTWPHALLPPLRGTWIHTHPLLSPGARPADGRAAAEDAHGRAARRAVSAAAVVRPRADASDPKQRATQWSQVPSTRSHVARARMHAMLASVRPFLLPCDLQRARAHTHEPTQPTPTPPPPCRPTTVLPRWRSALEEARLLLAEIASRDSSPAVLSPRAVLLGTEPASDTRQTGSGRLLGKLRPASTAGRFVTGPPQVLPPIGAPAHARLPQSADRAARSSERTTPVRMTSWRPPPRPPAGAAPGPPTEG